ncbi:hypothetical protein NKH56_32500, partial [Mesorhizobium sp. M1076]|uniref:hypothetical protein n=1 Tax=Mesorhizobium sp. M1076 TaxID=2957054 RepID=UPI00333AA903
MVVPQGRTTNRKPDIIPRKTCRIQAGDTKVAPSLLPLWEKVSPKATDEGCSSLAPAALRPTPLIRLGAARRSTFSHKETFAQKPIGDSVMMVEAGRFGMA